MNMAVTFDTYQFIALSTAKYQDKIVYPALGLCGEAGEVAEKVKKVLRDNDGVFTDEIKLEIAKELGDVLWYISALSDDIGYSLEQIALMNNQKLISRKERGVISGEGDNR